MIRASYRTKEGVTLEHSKYDTDLLRIPLSVEVSAMDDNQIESILNRFVEVGGSYFGGKKIYPWTKTSELGEAGVNEYLDTVKELIKENAPKYGTDTKVFINLDFNKDKSLRLTTSGPHKEGGRTIYDLEHLNELLDNIDAELPLTLEQSTRNIGRNNDNEQDLTV